MFLFLKALLFSQISLAINALNVSLFVNSKGACSTCDGSVSKPYKTVLEALDRTQISRDNFSIYFLESEHQVSSSDIKKRAGSSGLTYPRIYGTFRYLNVYGFINNSEKNPQRTKVIFTETFFSFWTAYSLSISNIHFEFRNLTLFNKKSYFIYVGDYRIASSFFSLENVFFTETKSSFPLIVETSRWIGILIYSEGELYKMVVKNCSFFIGYENYYFRSFLYNPCSEYLECQINIIETKLEFLGAENSYPDLPPYNGFLFYALNSLVEMQSIQFTLDGIWENGILFSISQSLFYFKGFLVFFKKNTKSFERVVFFKFEKNNEICFLQDIEFAGTVEILKFVYQIYVPRVAIIQPSNILTFFYNLSLSINIIGEYRVRLNFI